MGAKPQTTGILARIRRALPWLKPHHFVATVISGETQFPVATKHEIDALFGNRVNGLSSPCVASMIDHHIWS